MKQWIHEWHVCSMEKRVLVFLALLPFSFLLFAGTWLFFAPEHLYHCWDEAWPFLISWHPPFIHPWANSADGNLRDYFIWPEWSVHLVWFSFAIGIFVLPACVSWGLVGRGRSDAAH